jgi:hypothetical protein
MCSLCQMQQRQFPIATERCEARQIANAPRNVRMISSIAADGQTISEGLYYEFDPNLCKLLRRINRKNIRNRFGYFALRKSSRCGRRV